MHKIAIFASGRGSNAEKIIKYFQQHPTIKVQLIVSNKADAPVLQLAEKFGISSLVIHKARFLQTNDLLDELESFKINFIVLAGFLWLIPSYLVHAFSGRIVNIHPSLLPKYGGKGMYGMKVHEAVFESKDQETGITIHHVNEHYDEGSIIFQAKCAVTPLDTPVTIAQKVQLLEHQYFPVIIENMLLTT
ncbi:MAG: phosphoribosylglycinamide formyltransferase [Saprospiraceae bacterium]|nr:phosphoribosylglycinamide formyltransferase [Saprospiraceae bacterium]